MSKMTVIDVRQLGATGLGDVDDSLAINRAIQNSPGDNCRIFFPSGTYLLKNPILWPKAKDVQLCGEGSGKSTIIVDQPDATDSIGILLRGTREKPIRRAEISNITIKGISSNSPENAKDLIQVAPWVYESRFKNIEFCDASRAGMRFTANPDDAGSVASVVNCYFHDIGLSEDRAGGAILGGYPNLEIEGNLFKNIGNSGHFHAIYVGDFANIQIIGNFLMGKNSRLHLFARGPTAENVLISENTLQEVSSWNLIRDCPGVVVEGNIFHDSPLELSSDYAVFSNNMIFRSAKTPITSASLFGLASGVKVQRNRFCSSQLTPGGTIEETQAIYVMPNSNMKHHWEVEGNIISGYQIAFYAQTASGSEHFFHRNRVLAVPRSSTMHGILELSSSEHHHVIRDNWLCSMPGAGNPGPAWRDGGSNSQYIGNFTNIPGEPPQE